MNVVEVVGKYLKNSAAIVEGARRADAPLSLVCAVADKESEGLMIYGHDRGGVYSTLDGPVAVDGVSYPRGRNVPVTRSNYAQFVDDVLGGAKPNGVGIMQITWAGPLVDGKRDGGFFTQAAKAGLDLADPVENVEFGAGLLRGYLKAAGGVLDDATVRAVGVRYNGQDAYGDDLVKVWGQWKDYLATATPDPEPAADGVGDDEAVFTFDPESKAVLEGLTAALNAFAVNAGRLVDAVGRITINPEGGPR